MTTRRGTAQPRPRSTVGAGQIEEAFVTIRRVVIPGPSGREERRWQPVENLCCPVCRRPVRAEPPGYWRVADGSLPNWSHRDGRALCRIRAGGGTRIADPVPRSTAARTHRIERRGGARGPQLT